MPISKEAQDAESLARASERGVAANEIPPQTEAELTAPIADTPAAPQPIAAEAKVEKELPPTRGPWDAKRNEIIARYREQRATEAEDDNSEEIRRFAQDGLPPDLAALELPQPVEQPAEPEPVIEAQAPVTPAKRKLKVRGQELELTDEEIIAAAQKSLAADDYLDEAKKRLSDVAELQRQIEQQGGRPTPATSAQPGQQPSLAQPAEPATPEEDDAQHQDIYTQLGEKLQFGDPAEAGKYISQLIDAAADKKSKEASKDALLQERIRNERVRTQRILKDFQDTHPDLASDRYASAVMREHLIDMQKQDLKTLGIADAQLPRDPDTVAQWHEYYRTEGHNVRDVPSMLKTARDDFLKWKGVPEVKPANPAVPVTPTVNITPQRTERRAAIQPQPTRTVAPKPDSVVTAPASRERSDIVQEMMLARARPRNARMFPPGRTQ